MTKHISEKPPIVPAVFPGDAEEAAEVFGASRPVKREAAQHGWRILSILCALMAFAAISTDLYLPAMPAMSQSLGARHGMAEWTISGFLIGFSLGQLFWGPISDRVGRRLPIAFGLVLFAIGSAGCAASGSAWSMIGWRVVEAVGACASVVLARAMVRDLYSGNHAARMMSTLMTVMAIVPLIGPLAGGQILAYAGWRAIFWLLAGLGLMTLAALLALPETLPPEHRNHEPLARALVRYGELLGHRRVMACAGAGGFFYGGIYAYLAGTPSAYISYYHVSPQYYGLLFSIGIVGIMATNSINARVVTQVGINRMLRLGTTMVACAGILLMVISRTGWGGLTGLVIPLFLFVGVAGFIAANSIAGALNHYPRHAGAVSALVGFVHYGSGIIGSALVGILADGTPWPMGMVMGLCGIGSFLCARLVKSI